MKKRACIVSGLAALAALFFAPLAEASLTRSSAPAREAPALALTLAAPEPSEFSLFDGTEIARALASRPAFDLISITTDDAATAVRTRFVSPSELSADELPNDAPELLPITSVREQRFNLQLSPDVFGLEPLRGPPGDEASYPKTRYRVFGLLGTPILGELRGVSLELHWRSASFSCGLASGTVGWLSQDPMGDIDSPNLYGFVKMRPHELRDPLGLESNRQLIGLDTADEDIRQGNLLKGYGKKIGYGLWNALTFGFVERHDRVFEKYEKTGDTADYIHDTGVEAGRAAVVGAATLATGGAAGGGARTLIGAVARGAGAGAVTGLAGTAAGDIYDRARGEQGASVGDYVSSAAGGALFGGAAGAAGFFAAKAPVFRLGSEGEEHVRKLVGAPGGPEHNQVRFGKGQGARIVDVFYEGIAHESKVGYLAYSRKNAGQIIKDAKLIKTGEVDAAHWHFFRSGETGKIGADPRLLKMLDRFHIEYTIHE